MRLRIAHYGRHRLDTPKPSYPRATDIDPHGVMNNRDDMMILPGGSRDPFVIAEIGVNHDGDPDRAVELVDHAAAAGDWGVGEAGVAACADAARAGRGALDGTELGLHCVC